MHDQEHTDVGHVLDSSASGRAEEGCALRAEADPPGSLVTSLKMSSSID